MNHGSLFSGIGGFDLAAEWMGWDNKFHCEWNEFGQRVLKYYWPKAKTYEDITKTDFSIWRGKLDILTGGFPCQPYSSAGKRLGKEDERHLWPEMRRAIREIQPRWIVGENVLGLTNWNGGLVFEEVCTDLEAQGYEVQPYILPAAGVNAPHRRDRVWFVAYANGSNDGRTSRENEGEIREKRLQERDTIRKPIKPGEVLGASSDTHNSRTDKRLRNNRNGSKKNKGWKREPQFKFRSFGRNAPNPNSSIRERGPKGNQPKERSKPNDQQFRRYDELPKSDFSQFPSQSPLCIGDDGLPTELDGITFSKWRNESIKAYGNAVVPHVVLQLFKAIEQYENL